MPFATSHGAPISYRIQGSGPAVLLIAGTGYPSATWPPAVLDALARHYTLITFDHRGTGESPGTPDDYTTQLFAADAAAVIEAAGAGPVHLVGHSMGGRAAQWLGAEHPDLVSSVVLASTGPGRVLGERPLATGVPIRTALRLESLGYEGFIRDLQRRTFFTPEFGDQYPDQVDWLGDAFWNHRPALEHYLKHVLARQNHDASGILHRIEVPALVIVGELDHGLGDTGSHVDQARYLAEHLPDARLAILPRVAHGIFWERWAQTVETLLDWLATVASSPLAPERHPSGDRRRVDTSSGPSLGSRILDTKRPGT